MVNITKEQIDIALPKIKAGHATYKSIHECLSKIDVSNDLEFQKKFNGFYRIGRRPKDWYKSYYDLFEESKKKGSADFGEILDELHARTGKIEASFVSKLVHTIHQDKPILDQYVLRNLRLSQIADMKKNKLKIIQLYDDVAEKIEEIIQSDDGKYLVEHFTLMYPDTNITKTKMVDFVLWQIRE